jgi:deazaflavin-dependent oxidoreductase (nitroreductase family)
MSSTQNRGTATAAWAVRLLRNRRIVRAPVWLYRARLGFVFGSRLLMLEHTGRMTGARRFAVLEVVARPGPTTFVIASGFGARAQWFRNVRANPNVRVYLGVRGPAAATARLLTSEEASAALTAYASSHPREWATLKPVFEATLGARIDNRGTSLPMLALDLVSGRR